MAEIRLEIKPRQQAGFIYCTKKALPICGANSSLYWIHLSLQV